jgi:hypothetical protein
MGSYRRNKVAREPFPSATYEARTDILYLNAVAPVPYNKAPNRLLLFYFSASEASTRAIADPQCARRDSYDGGIVETGPT